VSIKQGKQPGLAMLDVLSHASCTQGEPCRQTRTAADFWLHLEAGNWRWQMPRASVTPIHKLTQPCMGRSHVQPFTLRSTQLLKDLRLEIKLRRQMICGRVHGALPDSHLGVHHQV
jgi:hypothetical protein